MTKKTKKAMSMLLVTVLVAMIAIGGMLAYLTDRDSKANVFTVGDVKIDLIEDFNQGAELTPGTEITKKVEVKNTGKNDAWVWVTVSVPAGFDTGALEITKNENLWTWGQAVDKTIDNLPYKEYTVLYNTALAADALTAEPAMTQVKVSSKIDITPKGDWYLVDKGTPTPINWKSSNGNPVIYVSAYAIQADENITTVADAYEKYNAQWGDNGGENGEVPKLIESFTDLKNAMYNGGTYALGADIEITDKDNFYFSKYVTAVMQDTTLDLNGHSITIDVDLGAKVADAPVLFYVYKDGASLTIVGDGDVIAKHDAFIVFPRSVSEGAYIYGGNYYNIDDTSGTKNDINAIVYSQTNNNIHIYGGTFSFKNVSGHCGGFNVYDNSGAEIVLHEGVLLSNSNYYNGSDADEIHLAEGCELKEVVIDGVTWFEVVKK